MVSLYNLVFVARCAITNTMCHYEQNLKYSVPQYITYTLGTHKHTSTEGSSQKKHLSDKALINWCLANTRYQYKYKLVGQYIVPVPLPIGGLVQKYFGTAADREYF